jgi:hypothetical protein
MSNPTGEPTKAKTLLQLREGMQDADLIQAHDALLRTASYVIGPDYYVKELARRDQERSTRIMVEQTATMVEQTRKMVWLTVIVAVFTLVSAAAVILSA